VKLGRRYMDGHCVFINVEVKKNAVQRIMLMNFTCYGNRIRPKEEVVVTFQEIRKIKYALNATTSFYQICYIVCRSEMKRDLLRRRCFNLADGVSMFDRMW